jgi:hypothetical protein
MTEQDDLIMSKYILEEIKKKVKEMQDLESKRQLSKFTGRGLNG